MAAAMERALKAGAHAEYLARDALFFDGQDQGEDGQDGNEGGQDGDGSAGGNGTKRTRGVPESVEARIHSESPKLNFRSKTDTGKRRSENGLNGPDPGDIERIPPEEEQLKRLETALGLARRRVSMMTYNQIMRRAFGIDRNTAAKYMQRAREIILQRSQRTRDYMRAENMDILDQIIGNPEEPSIARIRAIEVHNRMCGLEDSPKNHDEEVLPVIEVVVDSPDDVHHFNDIQQSLMDQKQRLIDSVKRVGSGGQSSEDISKQVFADIESERSFIEIESLRSGSIETECVAVVERQLPSQSMPQQRDSATPVSEPIITGPVIEPKLMPQQPAVSQQIVSETQADILDFNW